MVVFGLAIVCHTIARSGLDYIALSYSFGLASTVQYVHTVPLPQVT